MLFFSFVSLLKVRIHALAIKHMDIVKHIVIHKVGVLYNVGAPPAGVKTIESSQICPSTGGEGGGGMISFGNIPGFLMS